MNTPIYSQLIKHQQENRSSFHTPGHKCSDFLPKELLRLDFTELPDTDALYEAEGIILETEKNLSRLFDTERTVISSGGCTLAIQTMIKLAFDRSVRMGHRTHRMLFARNSHRSAVNTMALLGIDPVWVYPKSECGLFTGRTEAEDIETILNDNPDISAVYLTSPNYYGEISDIAAISEVCHRKNAILMVDNAHGSHLAFGGENLHPIHLGADMTACSLHKTLPVLTGGAVCNINHPDLVRYVKESMSLFGSTSPSYPIMCSIDLCCDYLLNGSGKRDYTLLEETTKHIKKIAEEKNLLLPERFGLCDPLRICINTSLAGISGKMQEQYFAEHHIDCEFCDGENAVLICTPFNSEEDFSRLETAVRDLPVIAKRHSFSVHIPAVPEKICTPREAMLAPGETVSPENAAGRTAADTACPCPPGVPVIMPGEKIDENIHLTQPIKVTL